jgi:hypothetical protein
MVHGPIEVLVVAFPGNQFSGTILPELAKVVEAGTITIIDGLFAQRDADGVVTFLELEELPGVDGEPTLVGLLERVEGLVSDEDVTELTSGLEPNSSAAILVIEHTWVKPLQAAIAQSGGVLLEDVRIPGEVADEVFDQVSTLG